MGVVRPLTPANVERIIIAIVRTIFFHISTGHLGQSNQIDVKKCDICRADLAVLVLAVPYAYQPFTSFEFLRKIRHRPAQRFQMNEKIGLAE